MDWQRLVFRDTQYSHSRHSGTYSGMTWSPFFRLFTPGPTSTTTPAPSCPRMDGNNPSGSAPESVYSSVWQMPVAIISTSTSPAFGPSSCTVSMASGAPALCATAARTSITSPPEFIFNSKRSPQRTRRTQRKNKNEEKQLGDKSEVAVREPVPLTFAAMDHQPLKGFHRKYCLALAFPPAPP